MASTIWLRSAAIVALAVASTQSYAQDTAPAADAGTEAETTADAGDIIVTATRRSQALSDVPLAVSAVTAESLQYSGATDIRQVAQISPSLLVTSTQSEAGASSARIRGIGTVGDNAGLESSVAVFVDGVYRSRSGTALTELGAIDRIEVLRGPQGTLFGRNASAGLIHVITAKPKYEEEGTAEISYGNYDFWRGVVGFTGPINETIAYRIDGVYMKRDGFLKEGEYTGSTGRDFNDRDRWLVRGQLLFEPTDQLSLRIIGDYADRDEQCCAAVYLPVRTIVPGGPGQTVALTTNPVRGVIQGLGGYINDDTYARRVGVTPGRDYRQDVRDWGLSAEANYELGLGTLTSITAYRDNKYVRGQDTDFTNLDIAYRPSDGSDFVRFRTFTQELRLQGEALGDRLDWLVGGYYAHEKLDMRSRLSYGADIDNYVNGLVRLGLPTFPGFNLLPETVNGLLLQQGVPAQFASAIAGQIVRPGLAANTGTDDRLRQTSRNYAFFTHNVFEVTDTIAVTVGARYTNERKKFDGVFTSTAPANAAAFSQSIANLTAFATANPALATPVNAVIAQLRGTGTGNSTGLAQVPGGLFSLINAFNGSIQDTRRESEWTGTASVSWKPTPTLLTYASYSRGYKAGGFNLDRSVINQAAPSGANLQFDAETVNAYEVGLKWNGPGVDINIAGFIQDFKNFQLNNFQGVNFIVENINGCSELAGGSGADSDVGVGGSPADALANQTGACTGSLKPGLRSKGVELEVFLRPASTLFVNMGATISESRYKNDLVGRDGRPLPSSLFQLPGRLMSNAAQYTITGSTAWTPPIGDSGLSALVYADFRYQSEINTGSDLNPEKDQPGFLLVNARLGLSGPDKAWGIEFWAQNLFDVNYQQIAFNAPAQGSGETRAVASGQQPNATRMYTTFLGEPRTYGVTLRTKF